MKEDMEIMKKNKFTKILLYSVISLVLAGVILLIFSYFGKEEEVKKTDFSQKDKKQEQVDHKKEKEENKEKETENENKVSTTVEKKGQETESNSQNKVTANDNTQRAAVKEIYKGKKLSESEGVGTTGKVFKSQKEALDFGKAEIKRLTDGDKKKRQFSISKVAADDGSLVGWTVDIFEDDNIEKIVSDPGKDTDEEKSKE